MGKKKKYFVPTDPKEDRLIVKGSLVGAAGHQPHFTGTGFHQDRRRRTRSAQRKEWQQE